MDYTDKIISDPTIMLGKPVIKGTRISVEIILRKLSEGMSTDQLLNAYTQLSQADIFAAFFTRS